MDILTLGKMNQMAKDVNVTLEYLANSTYSALKDVCDFQAGNIGALNTAAQAALDEIAAAGGGGSLFRGILQYECKRLSLFYRLFNELDSARRNKNDYI